MSWNPPKKIGFALIYLNEIARVVAIPVADWVWDWVRATSPTPATEHSTVGEETWPVAPAGPEAEVTRCPSVPPPPAWSEQQWKSHSLEVGEPRWKKWEQACGILLLFVIIFSRWGSCLKYSSQTKTIELKSSLVAASHTPSFFQFLTIFEPERQVPVVDEALVSAYEFLLLFISFQKRSGKIQKVFFQNPSQRFSAGQFHKNIIHFLAILPFIHLPKSICHLDICQ